MQAEPGAWAPHPGQHWAVRVAVAEEPRQQVQEAQAEPEVSAQHPDPQPQGREQAGLVEEPRAFSPRQQPHPVGVAEVEVLRPWPHPGPQP